MKTRFTSLLLILSFYSFAQDTDMVRNGIVWDFSGDSTFRFTVEPFLKLPEKFQKLKHPLKELLLEHKIE